MRTFRLFVLGLLFLPFGLIAQGPALDRVNFIQVNENGLQMAFPFAGGLDQPQFNEMDLDDDGVMDLVVFDRAGYEIIPFLNGGTPNTVDYDFAPEFEEVFPTKLAHYAVFRDFNCDGKMDIFTSNNDSMDSFIRVYEHVGSGSNHSYSVWTDTLMTDKGAGPTFLFLDVADIPGVDDVDNDGDLDILTFDPAGNFLEWHKNMAMENTGSCNGMEFVRAEACWGKFQESAQGADVSLNITCRVAPGSGNSPSSVHAGSTVAIFDEDGNGVKDIVLGDLTTNSLTKLYNAGTPTAALIDSAQQNFPIYDTPVEIDNFDAAFFLDVNNDGFKDMIAAPNAKATTFNLRNVWYYQNVATDGSYLLSQTSTRFLQKDMIDMGTCSYPAFFDYNSDGLMDLLVGNFNTKTASNNAISGVALYENVGTSSLPAFQLVSRDFENFSATIGVNVFGYAPTVGDLDGDGDQDLIIGESAGSLHFFENIAMPGQNADFVLNQSNFMGIDVGQFATPNLVDIDRDGKLDLVIGELAGNINYFRNTGTAQVPAFPSSPDNSNWGNIDTDPNCCAGNSVPLVFENPATNRYDILVGSEFGPILYYEDAESEFGGAFTLDNPSFGNIDEGFRSAIAAQDLNGDGKPEFITGNFRGGLGFYAETGTYVGGIARPRPKVSFDLFPNPNQGQFHITSTVRPGTVLDIRVLDLQGRTILQHQENFRSIPLNLALPQASPGIYFVQVFADGAPLGSRKMILR